MTIAHLQQIIEQLEQELQVVNKNLEAIKKFEERYFESKVQTKVLYQRFFSNKNK